MGEKRPGSFVLSGAPGHFSFGPQPTGLGRLKLACSRILSAAPHTKSRNCPVLHIPDSKNGQNKPRHASLTLLSTFDSAVCSPARLVLGLPILQQCSGCPGALRVPSIQQPARSSREFEAATPRFRLRDPHITRRIRLQRCSIPSSRSASKFRSLRRFRHSQSSRARSLGAHSIT